MKSKPGLILILMILCLGLSACGPSQEDIATMTAASWTATPQPTSTPTPVPYDLTVTVADEEGIGIPGATVALSESGESLLSDSSGAVTFNNLPGESATLDVSAPGYFAAQSSASLQRGANEATVTLSQDPNGLTLGGACLPEETLVYIDDFQDGEAQGWDAITFGMSGWSLQPGPDDSENMVVAAGAVSPNEFANLAQEIPGDYVWRLKFMVTGEGEYQFIINQNGGYAIDGKTVDNSNYTIFLGTQPGGRGPRTAAMLRFQDPLVDMIISNRWEGKVNIGIWHYLQISSYQGQVEVWLDDEQTMAYSDPQPLPAGNLVLGNSDLDPGAMVFYDNIAVCQLSSPFQSIAKPLSGFDVNVLVTDVEGNPLSGASLVLLEMDDMPGGKTTTDAEGKATLGDLPGADLTLFISAPGYHAAELNISIEKGTPLEISAALEPDPFALLPEKACATGENLLYLEDYQDGHAQGWSGFENGAPGLSLTPSPDEAGNLVAAMQFKGVAEGFGDRLEDGSAFLDAVWRFMFKPSGRFAPDSGGSFNWLSANEPFTVEGTQVFDSRYQIPFGSNTFELRRLQQPISNFSLISSSRTPSIGEWNFFEISSFKGLSQVWLNGVQIMSAQDPNPLPAGTIGLEAWLLRDTDPILYFDNMSVCELNTPFVSILTE